MFLFAIKKFIIYTFLHQIIILYSPSIEAKALYSQQMKNSFLQFKFTGGSSRNAGHLEASMALHAFLHPISIVY